MAGSRQLVEQRLAVFQVGGVEALGERAVEGREQLARLVPPALLAPQPGEEFAADSPLEDAGFEPLVPPVKRVLGATVE